MKTLINKILPYVLALAALVLNLSVSQSAQAQTGSSPNTGSLAIPDEVFITSPITSFCLSSGKVLLVGGLDEQGTTNDGFVSPQLYDPTSGTWTTKSLLLNDDRTFFTRTVLPNGKVLVAGGEADSSPNGYVTNTELFDPVTETWTNTGTLN